MENENQEKTVEIGLTKGPRLEIRSVRRGKITVDESLVERKIVSAKFGEIMTSDVVEVYWVEYPNLAQPAGPFDSRYAAEQKLKVLRAGDEDNMSDAGAVRAFAIAQGIARRVKTCEREIAESSKMLTPQIRDAWGDALIALRQACEAVKADVNDSEILAAYFQQAADKEKVA